MGNARGWHSNTVLPCMAALVAIVLRRRSSALTMFAADRGRTLLQAPPVAGPPSRALLQACAGAESHLLPRSQAHPHLSRWGLRWSSLSQGKPFTVFYILAMLCKVLVANWGRVHACEPVDGRAPNATGSIRHSTLSRPPRKPDYFW